MLNSGVKHGYFFRFVKFAAIFSVMLGTMALLISMSVLQGFEDNLASTAINFTSHIKLEKFKARTIDNYPKLIQSVTLQFPSIAKASPFIQKEALISTKSDVDGIILKAIEPLSEATGITSKIISGTKPLPNTNQILIGESLANKLNVQIGSTVTIFLMLDNTSKVNQFPEIEKFEICGIYRTGMTKYDDISVFCELKFLSGLANFAENECSGIDILLTNTSQISLLSNSISDYLGFPYFCSNVFELHSAMFAWIELQKQPIPLVLGLISLVAVMNIITILLILIVEKTHTIGILRTLGMNKKSILAIFLVRGTSIGIIGTGLGALFALILTYLQQVYHLIRLNGAIYFLDSLPISIVLDNYLLVIGVSVSFAFIITLLPALTALRVKPIKAINFR